MTSSPPRKTSPSKSSKPGYSRRTKINVPANYTPPPKTGDGFSNAGSCVEKNSWFQLLPEVWNHFVKCHCHGSSLLKINAQMTWWLFRTSAKGINITLFLLFCTEALIFYNYIDSWNTINTDGSIEHHNNLFISVVPMYEIHVSKHLSNLSISQGHKRRHKLYIDIFVN